ncbi:class II histone deacetylase [Paracoccus ravus]|uniref:class II histone deacetylase n=1 Tax=Paracoccus ravus TaxID=2447760 RepID=UPI001ADB4C53|nr:class II histone deacetylase [Paracoccus ravus]
MTTAFYTDELTFWHHAGPHALIMPAGGWVQVPEGASLAESPESKRRLRNLIAVSGLEAHLKTRTAPALSEEDLRRIHPADYLQRFRECSREGRGEMGPNAPVGPGSYEIAALSAGLATGALDAILSGDVRRAYALSRPPGHHCLPDQAMGFCFMANIPLAIEAMKRKHGIDKVAVIDWDVHHGNGTQAIYEERPDVLTISLHQENCFPAGYSGAEERGKGAGEGTNINIPLPAGSGHATYIRALERIVLPALRAFRPEAVIIACGFDAGAFDPLARMMLTARTYREMTEMMVQVAEDLCDGRLLAVHEGGYSEAYVPFCGMAVLEALSGQSTSVTDPLAAFVDLQQPGERHQAFMNQWVDDLTAALQPARCAA